MRISIVLLLTAAHLAVASPSFADGPLAASAARAAREQPTAPDREAIQQRTLWSGFAMVGAGVTLVALSNTFKTTEDCVVPLSRNGDSVAACSQGVNKALLWGGGGLIGVGGALMWTSTRTVLAAGPRHVTYQIRF